MTEKQKRNSRPIFGQHFLVFSLGKVPAAGRSDGEAHKDGQRNRLSHKAYEGMSISGYVETKQRRVSVCAGGSLPVDAERERLP